MGEKGNKILELLQKAPKRKLSEVEKQMIFIVVEKCKLSRERALSTLNKAFLLFALFIVLAFLSRTNNILSTSHLNLIFLLGICLLIIVTIYYQNSIKQEEKVLDEILESFMG
jgi:hypothetical protein